jgi:hypothetical protein
MAPTLVCLPALFPVKPKPARALDRTAVSLDGADIGLPDRALSGKAEGCARPGRTAAGLDGAERWSACPRSGRQIRRLRAPLPEGC